VPRRPDGDCRDVGLGSAHGLAGSTLTMATQWQSGPAGVTVANPSLPCGRQPAKPTEGHDHGQEQLDCGSGRAVTADTGLNGRNQCYARF
jgi:hypothetical protein